MKKILMMLTLVGVVVGCTSADKKFNEMTITESEPQFILEDVEVVEGEHRKADGPAEQQEDR